MLETGRNDHQTKDRLMHEVCQLTHVRQGDLESVSACAGSLLSAFSAEVRPAADLLFRSDPGFGADIAKEAIHDARHRPRIRLPLQSPCGGDDVAM